MIKYICVIAAVVSVAVGEVRDFDDDPTEPTEIITKMCKLQNDTHKVPIVQAQLEKFFDCFYNLFEPKEKAFAAFMPLNVEKHCVKAKLLRTCIEDFSDVLIHCLNKTAYLPNNAGIAMVLNYLCLESPPENEATKFALFFPNKGRDCFRRQFLQCTWTQEHKPHIATEASIIFSVNDPCGDHMQMSSCLVTAIEKCASKKRPGRWPSSCCPINLQCTKPPR